VEDSRRNKLRTLGLIDQSFQVNIQSDTLPFNSRSLAIAPGQSLLLNSDAGLLSTGSQGILISSNWLSPWQRERLSRTHA
jgi:hypothetical protein